MNDIVETTASMDEGHGAGLLLANHHRRLEARCRDMLGCAYADDSRGLGSAWGDLELEILGHMAAEEEVILPSYATHAPTDARRIRDDHARIRSLATQIGIDVELHEIRVERLHRLVEALGAHSASEDAAMYPWATDNIVLLSQRMLFAPVARWLAPT